MSDHCVCQHCTPEQAKNPDAPCPLCKLEAQLAEARALLKELEWSGLDGWVPPNPCCPVCPGQKDEMGHEPGCRLAKALGEEA
jgi:hypothetical protein